LVILLGVFLETVRTVGSNRLVGRFSLARPEREPRMSHDKLQILDAAVAVVTRNGIANLTLDAVAAEAGLSKGGLLHHFPSKDRLVEAMVIRTAEEWRATLEENYAKTPAGPGRLVRAVLDHCLLDAANWTEELRERSAAVFAALAQNPALIAPLRVVHAEVLRRAADDGLPNGVADAVVAAVDGLWLNWVLGFGPLDQPRVERVRQALLRLLRTAQESS
jgi:AcrR family transcriptional regulator